ncbi:sodium/sulfate transporter [Salmonella enterica]|nr:sodium/sulfate transporter [Salmonella enterica]
MNGELIWVLSLLAIAVVLFATGKVRMDAVALFVIVAFVLSGTLTLPEAFSGFSDPNVILIAPYLLLATALCAPALLRWSAPGWLKWRAAVKSRCWFY